MIDLWVRAQSLGLMLQSSRERQRKMEDMMFISEKEAASLEKELLKDLEPIKTILFEGRQKKNVSKHHLNIRIGVNSFKREERWQLIRDVHEFVICSAYVIQRKRWQLCSSFIVHSISIVDEKRIQLRLEGYSFVVRPILILSGIITLSPAVMVSLALIV